MKLYVCYGTFTAAPRPGGHPCGNAYKALKEAGHEPEVIRSYGFGLLPDLFNQTPGRKEVKRLTSNNWVPVLVTDDETVIQGSHKIADWARANPPGGDGGTAPGGNGGMSAGEPAEGAVASTTTPGETTGGATGGGEPAGGQAEPS
jgi:hypothetical protein